MPTGLPYRLHQKWRLWHIAWISTVFCSFLWRLSSSTCRLYLASLRPLTFELILHEANYVLCKSMTTIYWLCLRPSSIKFRIIWSKFEYNSSIQVLHDNSVNSKAPEHTLRMDALPISSTPVTVNGSSSINNDRTDSITTSPVEAREDIQILQECWHNYLNRDLP